MKTAEPSEVVCVCVSAVRVQTGPEAGPRPCGAYQSGNRCSAAAAPLLSSFLLCSPLLLASPRSSVRKLLPSHSLGSVFSGKRKFPGSEEEVRLDLLSSGEVYGISRKVKVLHRDVTTSGEIL